jgi:hypothetical protein
MSRGQHDDLKKTIREMNKPSDLIDGKNWLRHDGQAMRIDEMFLTDG